MCKPEAATALLRTKVHVEVSGYPPPVRDPVLLILSIVTFAIIQAPPGNYSDYIRSQLINLGGASYEQADAQAKAYAASHGLDKPMVQYFNWIGAMVTKGDFGYSMYYNRPLARLSPSACRARSCSRLCAIFSLRRLESHSGFWPQRSSIVGWTRCCRVLRFSA